jgi:hypothetical protein
MDDETKETKRKRKLVVEAVGGATPALYNPAATPTAASRTAPRMTLGSTAAEPLRVVVVEVDADADGAPVVAAPVVAAPVDGASWVRGVVTPAAGVFTPWTPQNAVEYWMAVKTSS